MITVIIPSCTLSNLNRCAEAVQRRDPCDVIAVWDRSSGNATPPPCSLFRVREVDTPFNFARNCNIGIHCAEKHSDIVLLNDDALLLTNNGFSALETLARRHREYGILGAVTNVTGQPLQHPQRVGLREVPHFAFVAVLIPRRTLDAVGLLDERYCLDYGVEDRDYCEVVTRAGLKCGVYDGCYVDHAQLRSTFRGDPHASRSFQLNWKLFCQKWNVPA
jgi:GT2 family glycosyltransferase